MGSMQGYRHKEILPMPNPQRMGPATALAAIRFIGPLGAVMAFTLMSQQVNAADDAPPIVNEKFTNLAPAIKMLRAEIGQDRRDIVAAAMLLTPSEASTDEYLQARDDGVPGIEELLGQIV
jgi:hypothetical protein